LRHLGLNPFVLFALVAAILIGCTDSAQTTPCETDEQCTLPEVCSADKLCKAPDPPQKDDAPCKHEAHCQSGFCFSQEQAAEPKKDSGVGDLARSDAGVATDAATNGSAAADGAVSDAGAIPDAQTTADFGLVPPTGPVCKTPCEKAEDCPAGLSCAPLVGRPTGQDAGLYLVCQKASGDHQLNERCTKHADCKDGICDPKTKRCTRSCGDCPARMSCEKQPITRQQYTLDTQLCREQAAISIVDLGPVDTPQVGANPVNFTIAKGTRSFVVVAIDDDGLRVGIRKLVAPDGSVLVDLDKPQGAPMKSGPYVGSGTAVVPGSELIGSPLQPGEYTIVVGTYDPKYFDRNEPVDGSVERLAVITRRDDLQAGALDLNIHIAPGIGTTAAKAKSDKHVQSTLDRVRGLYQNNLGVTLGTVRYFDLPKTYDTIADGNTVREVCSSRSVPGDGQAINVMLIKDLGFTAGFAGGIGAPPGIFGLRTSCVVLEKQGSANITGVLMAHELGHHLGLWHTTELHGGQDPLADTPVCPDNTPVKKCPDYRNLMFPTFPVSDPLTLSAAQRYVVRLNPWLYERVSPQACGERSAVLVEHHGFAGGVTRAEDGDTLAGSCGGSGHPERIHLVRVPPKAKKLSISVKAIGFTAVVHARQGECQSEQAEIGCQVADSVGKTFTLDIETPPPGPLYVIVDGNDGAGFYTLSTRIER
jgi:hypothetical protein